MLSRLGVERFSRLDGLAPPSPYLCVFLGVDGRYGYSLAVVFKLLSPGMCWESFGLEYLSHDCGVVSEA